MGSETSISGIASREATVNPVLMKRLAEFVGKGADRPGFSARAPINLPLIKQMTSAVGDRNPIYADEALARRSVHQGIVAPPLWLFSWMMSGLEGEADQAQLDDGTPYFYAAPGGQRRTPTGIRTIRDELKPLLCR